MLCERCHCRRAVVHLVSVVNGRKTETHLCRECADEKNIMHDSADFLHHALQGFSWNPFFGNDFMGGLEKEEERLFRGLTSHGTFPEKEEDENGLFKDSGGFEGFRNRLKESLKSGRPGSGEDTRRTEIRENTENKDSEEVLRLKAELENCIKKEKYEEAARLRDRINTLEKGKNH